MSSPNSRRASSRGPRLRPPGDAVRSCLVGALVLLSVLLPGSATALEKTLQRFPDERDWTSSGANCELAYYNVCTGWVWVWSGWQPNERVGVVFDACCSNARLVSTWLYVWTGAPGGYGFTGTFTIQAADENGCPTGPPLLGDLFNPHHGNEIGNWRFPTVLPMPIPDRCVAMITFGPGSYTPIALPSDHPPAGPTGPPACGTCYPMGRPPHSFRYGTVDLPLCPGTPLTGETGNLCSAELLFTAELTCTGPEEEQRTWHSIEGLYR